MDIDIARTFLEVVNGGTFIAAADRLHLTQTAISARIRTLEEELGRKLFVRNKAGARLTPAGELFQRDAVTLVQTWERARQRVALPPGRRNLVSIGGEFSLWNPLLTNWLVWMHKQQTDLALRAEVDGAAHLLEKVQSGALDLAVLYSPPAQSGLTIELLTAEKLVMVTTSKSLRPDPENYVHVDWGPTFTTSLRTAFPNFTNPVLSVSHGPLALAYLLTVGGCGYLRLGVVRDNLRDRTLHLVDGAPEFSYSVHAVYSARAEADMLARARAGLRACLEASLKFVGSRNGRQRRRTA